MKSKVIKFFQNLPKEKHEQFNRAFELYRQSEGKNPVMERAVNASGFSENGLENLLYDLQKLHWITDVEKSPLAPEGGIKAEIQKLKVKSENEKWDSLDPDIANLFQSLLAMSIEDRNAWGANRQKQFGDFDELLQLSFSTKLEEVSDCLTRVWEYMSTHISIEQNEDLQDEKFDLEEELEATTEENENLKDELDKLKSLPKIDAKSIRVEFPFLNEKDCPDEFKILVADKITAWNDYLECHKTLLSIESGELVTDDDSKAEIAKSAITSFDENQKIYDELVAYAESGKVLGVHPIFKRLQLTREVEEMKADELHNYKGSSAKYFSVNKTALAKAEKAKDTDKIELITTRVVERELKLALVNKKLGINPK
jgi:hypothetical protein